MTVKRMDNVGIVVEDLDAAIGFFAELVGGWVKRCHPWAGQKGPLGGSPAGTNRHVAGSVIWRGLILDSKSQS